MAAKQGYAPAQNDLGYCYEHGEGVLYGAGRGVNKDQAEAVRWFCKAAEGGDADAMHRLGKCYLAGTGVSKYKKQAKQWLQKAVEKGCKDAQPSLDKCGGFFF